MYHLDDLVREMEIKALAFDILEDALAGPGGVVLPGREMELRPCRGCLIDPEKPATPDNVMASTSGVIGLLSDTQKKTLCSEMVIVPNGRCERARAIRTAAHECKAQHPGDAEAFFRCYIPRFKEAGR